MTGYIERVLIVLNPDGSFKAAHAEDERGYASPLTAEALTTVLPQAGPLLTRATQAEAALAIKDAELQGAISERDALRAQIDEAAAKAKRVVSPSQARLALKRANMLAQVEALIDGLPKDDDVHIVWDYANEWHRDSPFINNLGAALGLSAQQIDDLFALAATL